MHIEFPEFTGAACNMMPFVQGDPSSLPDAFGGYADVVRSMVLKRGAIGFLTIDESHVNAGASQRGFGAAKRTVHVEVGHNGDMSWWGNRWGLGPHTRLRRDTRILIANSVAGTCRLWDVEETSATDDGDLSACLDHYPESTGRLMDAGEVAEIGIFTPHECVTQAEAGPRQFVRVVGSGVRGRDPHFTRNPIVPWS